MLVVVLMVSTVLFVACNKEEAVVPSGNFLNDVAEISTKPEDKNPLFSSEETAFLQQVAADNDGALFDFDNSGEYDNALIRAAMLLYNTANASRINNDGLSLMVQDSLGGNEMGRVYMHGFTLQSGDKWYYQLVSQAAQGDVEGFEALADLLQPIAGNLQVAYTNGDNKYHYAYIMGSNTQLDCSVPTFPYASFIIPEGDEPVVYDGFEAYQAERNCRDSQLELTNMRILPSLLNDEEIKITYNAEEGFYTLCFAIDCDDQSSADFKEFESMSKLDLDTGTFLKINNTIVGWRAEVEIWDNGYAKAFRSYEDWKMRVIGNDIESHPKNEFEYLWNASEIMAVVSQDESFKTVAESYPLASDEELIERAIEFYSDPQSVYVFDWFTFWIALGASILGLIVVVIIILAILVKVGKAPKLAAALKRMAQRDRERRQAIKEQDLLEKEKKKELKAEKKGAKAEKREEKREAKAEKKNEIVSIVDNTDGNDSIEDMSENSVSSDNSVDSDKNNL